jgi:S-adenosylmethionine decarboxylase proenzyme
MSNVTLFQPTGTHVLLDVQGVRADLLNNATALEKVLVDASMAAGATILRRTMVQFEPQGVTGFLVLAESHVAIHTYPEHGVAMVDCFTCGLVADPHRAIQCIVDALQPTAYQIKKVGRGQESNAHI